MALCCFRNNFINGWCVPLCPQLASLPPSMGCLVSLQELHATNNTLTSLPDTFSGLTALNTLKLTRNALEYVPTAVLAMTNLTSLG